MASKQDNYLRMHHPSIFKKMKKGGKVEDYAKGGKVKYYAYGGRNTDTVPAMLTPGEVVLNEEQQIDLGNTMAGGGKVSAGQAKADALFKHIGVPGFQEGVVLPKRTVTENRYKTSGFETAMANRDTTGSNFKSIIPTDTTGADTSLLSGYKPLTPPTSLIPTSNYKPLERPKSIIPEGKAGGGLVDKKDALMAYYGGGKVKKKKKKRGY